MPPKSSFGKSRNREFVNKLTILETIRSISKIKWRSSLSLAFSIKQRV